MWIQCNGKETNTLWKQDPRGLYQDRTALSGLHRPTTRATGFGTVLGDFANAGALDVAIVNGAVLRSSPTETGANRFWSQYAQRNQILANDGTSPATVIRVCVKLHNPDAALWVERQPLTLTGTERTFESSNLEPGQTYRYEVIAKWKTGGRDQAETRVVTAQPGDLVTVDFTVPE